MPDPTFCASGSQRGNINMHIHSHFSYNAENWSPSRIARACATRGLDAAGLIDFDVLDGLDEFLAEGERLGLRTVVGVEARVFYDEFADEEIDSPGEPGVSYMAGIGFCKVPARETRAADGLQRWRDNAQKRNAELIERINPHVPQIALDYETQVVPLSPGNCPTERHIIAAYMARADEVFSGDQLTQFWLKTLGKSKEDVEALLASRTKMGDVVRARFAKRGGFGYVQPTAESFPKMSEFIDWVRDCGAIPMESWLDGTGTGEADAERLIDTSVAKGCRVLNLIPDRNWNIADREIKKMKIANLRTIVELADARNLPLCIGTEMNKAGLPFVDDLRGPVLSEFAETFYRGAMVLVGHTICGRFAEFGYLSQAAEETYKTMEKRNDFFALVGALPPVTVPIAAALRGAGPEKALNKINDSVRAGAWTI